MGGGGMQETGSTTTELPDWVEDRYKDTFEKEDVLYEIANQVAAGMDPREILGTSELEQLGLAAAMEGFDQGEYLLEQAGDFSGIDQAIEGMYGSIGNYDDLYEAASQLSGYTTDRIGDKTIDEMRDSYTSGYTDDVVETTLASSDRKRQQERLAEQLATTAAGGTSNTRGAISQAVGDQLYGMNRSEIEAKLRDDAFRTAADYALQEAGLGQNEDQMNYDFLADAIGLGSDITGEQQSTWKDIWGAEDERQNELTNLSTLWQGLGSAKGGTLASFGETERLLEQEQLDADRTHDMDMVNWLTGILGQTSSNVDQNVGTTTTSEATPSAGQQLLGLGTTILGGWLSDERAKEGISDAAGGALDQIVNLDVKEYSYKDDAPGHRKDRHKGLIAQDVAENIPNSTYVGADGLNRIDPFVVAATIVQAVDELDAKTRPHRRWRQASIEHGEREVA